MSISVTSYADFKHDFAALISNCNTTKSLRHNQLSTNCKQSSTGLHDSVGL